jgi:hypothetical protein
LQSLAERPDCEPSRYPSSTAKSSSAIGARKISTVCLTFSSSMRFSPPVNLHRNPDVACHVRSWEHNFEPHTDFDEDPVSWSDVPPVFNPNDCVEIALASPSTADKLKKALVKVCSSLQKYNHVADGIVELEAEGFIPRRHPFRMRYWSMYC